MSHAEIINIFDKKKNGASKNDDANTDKIFDTGKLLIMQRIIKRKQKINQGDIKMDESTKMLIERLDKDLREHRQEIRDRDARLQAEFQEREKRIHEEVKEREDRILSAIGELKSEMNQIKREIHQNISSIRQEVSENTKHVHNLVRQNFWGNITTVLAILGICATIGFTVWAALSSMKNGG